MRSIDINCDCGESFGNWTMGADAFVLPRVSTANIACGFHAGDPVTLVNTVKLAHEHGVAVGAHPGLPDLLGFGRRRMTISARDCYAYTIYQVGAVQAAARAVGAHVGHVKPHGVLMSMLQTDASLAQAFCEAVAAAAPAAAIYFVAPLDRWVLPAIASRLGIRVVPEVYPDLSYDDDANVVVQRHKTSTQLEDAIGQLESFFDHGGVRTISGQWLSLEAQSVCVHGDGPNVSQVLDAFDALRKTRSIELHRITENSNAA